MSVFLSTCSHSKPTPGDCLAWTKLFRKPTTTGSADIAEATATLFDRVSTPTDEELAAAVRRMREKVNAEAEKASK